MSRCIIVIFSICSYFVLFLGFQFAYANSRTNPLISLVSTIGSQDASDYTNPKRQNVPLISKPEQHRLSRHALHLFFSPWINGDDYRSDRGQEISLADAYLQNPQYGFNFHMNSKKWIRSIVDNMNLKGNAIGAQNAIMVQNANMRNLPTRLPIFESYKIAGQGYPFDTLSVSALWVGEPVRVLNTSTDGAWVLVEDHNYFGWVRQRDIAYVNKSFIKTYRSKQFIAITQDNAPIKDQAGNFLFYSRIGMIFPVIHNSIQVPVRLMSHHAGLVNTKISKKNYASYPLKPTPANFAKLMNSMMGEPYAWGGIYLLRDCSLTTQDLLFPFGVLLPRNSLWQAKSARRIMLTGMGEREKERYIMQHGKPFFTLLHLPGHITVYMGNRNGHPIIFQNKWGMQTLGRDGHYGRAIVGKADIAPLHLGSNIPNSTGNMLDGVNSMTILAS